jgi:hypothetical protein
MAEVSSDSIRASESRPQPLIRRPHSAVKLSRALNVPFEQAAATITLLQRVVVFLRATLIVLRAWHDNAQQRCCCGILICRYTLCFLGIFCRGMVFSPLSPSSIPWEIRPEVDRSGRPFTNKRPFALTIGAANVFHLFNDPISR